MTTNQNNPWFPLPKDYLDLTIEGQREARMATLRDQSTPDKLVWAWDLFRRLYLIPTGEAFYKGGFKESPPFHYDMVHDLGQYARNAAAAPRGFSKCLCGKELVLTGGGQWVPISKLKVGDKLLSLSPKNKIQWAKVTAYENTGKKQCLKITTKQGHSVSCTPEHRILANNTWIEAGKLKKNDLIATPRTSLLPESEDTISKLDSELLGVLAGDGNVIQMCKITMFEREIINLVEEAVNEHPDWVLRCLDSNKGRYSITKHWKCRGDTPIIWLKKHGLFGHKSTKKRIPNTIWAASNECLAAFLRGLFDTDGTVNKQSGSIQLTLANRELIRDVQLALLRLGIRSRFTYNPAKFEGKQFDAWFLHISSAEARLKFRALIGFRVKRKMVRLDNIEIGHDATDYISFSFEEKQKLSPSMWEFRQQFGLRIDNHYRITRPKLKRVAKIMNRQDLMDLATSDIYWDPVVSIEDGGIQETCDIQLKGNANFLCEGMFVHNSTIIGVELPIFLLLTRPYFPISECLSTDAAIEERFDTIMEQLTGNDLILQDFGPQKPKRGDAIWNRHHIHLLNGASLRGFSVMGKKRGIRPRLFILDDPEADPTGKGGESQTSQQLILERFEQILFRQIIPMLEQGSSIFWIGTIISRRSFLYRAINMADARFDHWNRKVFKAEDYDPSAPSNVKVLWPEMWSEEMLKIRRAEIGEAAYSSEYQNEPISETERLLSVRPRRNEYTVDASKDDPYYANEPFKSKAKIIWCNRIQETDSYEEHKEPFDEWVNKLFRITAVDYAVGLGQYNDYSCAIVMGFDTRNTLWVLDMWMGRVKESELTQRVYQISRKWMVKAIGIEAVSMQIWFAEAVRAYVENSPDLWKPRVIPVRYPSNTPKESRIAGLEPRFHQGLIKYPAHLSDKYPFSMLYSQTMDFTYDLALLPFDDAIDTLAMSQYIVHSRGIHSMTEENKDKSLLARIKKGEPIIKGLPLVMADEISGLTEVELSALIDRKFTTKPHQPHKKRPDIRRPAIIR